MKKNIAELRADAIAAFYKALDALDATNAQIAKMIAARIDAAGQGQEAIAPPEADREAKRAELQANLAKLEAELAKLSDQ